MGYKRFEIVLDNGTGVYYTGTPLTGRVVLDLDRPTTVRGILIKFRGRGKVSMIGDNHDYGSSVSHKKTAVNRYVTFSAEEDYFSNQFFLIGSESGKIVIGSGEHWYPFSTTLPINVPSTFCGKRGYVRYLVKATLVKQWIMHDKIERDFTVVKPVDLNYIPHVKDPVRREASKSLWSLLGRTQGVLTLAGTLPYSGYVPGETVPMEVEVNNGTGRQVAYITCQLIKEITWVVWNPHYQKKVSKEVLVKKDIAEGIPSSGSKSWIQTIEIPQTPFYNLDDCSFIKMKFYLQLEAHPRGLHTPLGVEFPLTLGNVPLQAWIPVPPAYGPPAYSPPGPPAYQQFEPSAPSLASTFPYKY